MSTGPFLAEDQRRMLLGLRSALYDGHTGLYAFPYHFDELQRMVDFRSTLGVVYLELFEDFAFQAINNRLSEIDVPTRNFVDVGQELFSSCPFG